MIVKVDLNRNDVWEFYKYVILKRPKLRHNLILNLIAAPIMTFLVLISFSQRVFAIPMILILILTIIVGFLADIIFIYITKRQIPKRIDQKNGLLGEHSIEIDEKGVKETTSVNESIQLWKGVYSIEDSKEQILIFLDSSTAHVIPKRSFDTNSEAYEFYQKSFDYLTKSRDILLKP